MKPLTIGIEGSSVVTVNRNNLASSLGSGAVDVFATPYLILLMEEAAVAALAPYVEDGESSVGSRVDIKHLAATPPGMKVTATATLTGINGRRLSFEVEARDDVEVVGRGTHERYVIEMQRFMDGAMKKATAKR